MEFLYHSLLEGEELQLVCWVVGFSLAQASTDTGYDCFGAILPSLVEDSPQTSATSISMKLEQLTRIHICKNGCHGTEFLQVIKGLLTPAVPTQWQPSSCLHFHQMLVHAEAMPPVPIWG